MKIKLSRLAAQDLQSAFDYISKENINAANSVIKRILESIEKLTNFPAMGRAGRVPHTKELVVSGSPFIIVYQVHQNTMYIVRIIHSSKKWP